MNSNNRVRVLVTALGTMNCATIVKELRKLSKDIYIIGADINPIYCIFTATEVDEYYEFPKVTDDRERYFDFVRTFCVEHNINIYYCVVDEEVELMSLHRDELESLGVTLCVANTEAVITCHWKDKFAVWSENNIPEYCIKRFHRYEDIVEEDFPLFVKPIEGRASIGCKAIANPYNLLPYKNNWDQFIIQKFTDGELIVADIVRCRSNGLIQVCQRKELLRNSNGCGVAVEIVFNKEVEKVCHIIAEKLNLNGVLNAEFFVSDNVVKVIEVNPRIPAGVEYSCMAGLNVVQLAMKIALGETITEVKPINVGSYYVKRYETYEV